MKENYKKIIIAVVAVNFLIRIPFLNFPAHWDEGIYFGGVQRVFYNKLNPFIEFWAYKPPLLFELTAILYKIFGPSRWTGRLIIALCSSLGILLTYKIGEKLFGALTGFLAALLLFFHPLYFTQSNLFLAPIPLTSLFLLVLYAYFSGRKTMYLITASLFVLSKEIAVLAIISLIIFDLATNIKHYKIAELLRKKIYLAMPISLFFIWMLLNKIFFGWFLWPGYLTYFSYFKNPSYKPFFNEFISVSFKEQLLWFIYGLSFLGLLFSVGTASLRKKLFRKEVVYFLSLAIVFPFLYYSFYFLPRYLLFTYPGLLLAFSWFLTKIWHKKQLFVWLTTVTMCLFFIFHQLDSVFLNPRTHLKWGGERNLSYLRFVWMGKKVANFVNKRFPSKPIVSDWLINPIFEETILGYTDTPYKVVVFENCSQLNRLDEFLLITSMHNLLDRKSGLGRCALRLGLEKIGEVDIGDKFPNAASQLPVIIYQKSSRELQNGYHQ